MTRKTPLATTAKTDGLIWKKVSTAIQIAKNGIPGRKSTMRNLQIITRNPGLLKTLLVMIYRLLMLLKKEPDGEREDATSEKVYTWEYRYAIVNSSNIVPKCCRETVRE